MIKAQLTTALDFAREPKKKGKAESEKHTRFSYRDADGQWWFVASGPTYHNTHKILEFDDDGLAQLKAVEHKPEDRPS